MQYLRGWTALRADPQWMGKVGWGSLLMLSTMCIPALGGIALRGWTTLMLRRAVSGQDAPLPRLEFETDYLGKLLGVGFKGFLAQLLWSLPLFALIGGGMCCMYAAVFLTLGTVFAGAQAGGEAGAGIGAIGGILLLIVCYGVLIVLLVIAQMVMQIAVMRAELTDDLNASLRFGEVMNMTKMLAKELFIGMFVLQMVAMVAGIVTLFTLYLGLLPSVVVMQVIVTYYRAELYRVYLEKGGQPLPIGPLAVEGGDPPTVGPNQQAYTAPAQF